MQVLVLASGSQYRAQLLQRLNLPFSTISPDIDETPHTREEPAALASRLARQKAHAAQNLYQNTDADQHPLFIASDQVAAVDNVLLGKPGSEELACQQLQSMQGRSVTFFTALHLYSELNGREFTALDTTVATLRALKEEEIQRYVAADQPLDCAGSFKVESLGISLFERVTTDDPTALIGLPMIAVCRGLRHLSVPVP